MSVATGSSKSIKAIDAKSVHQITSGQVVIDLQTAVKELVENSLDAGATSVEVRFKNYGLNSVEVIDNGSGIPETDFEDIGRKHHTSKLSSFEDLTSITSFGFRGEAMSSLCALCESVTVTTAVAGKTPMGTVLELGKDGEVIKKGKAPRQRGTTVMLSTPFVSLPVRRKELERNIKREFGKALTLLNAYALGPCCGLNAGSSQENASEPDVRSRAVRLVVTNQPDKGQKTTCISLPLPSPAGTSPSVRNGVTVLWGGKALDNVMDFSCQFQVPRLSAKRLKRKSDIDGEEEETFVVRVKGLISSPVPIPGSNSTSRFARTAADRQFFYINGRPCTLPKAQKALNETYRSYTASNSAVPHFPLVIMDFNLPGDVVDVNVTPDKRTIVVHAETHIVDGLKVALDEVFSPTRSTYGVNSTLCDGGTTTTKNVVRSFPQRAVSMPMPAPAPAPSPATANGEADSDQDENDKDILPVKKKTVGRVLLERSRTAVVGRGSGSSGSGFGTGSAVVSASAAATTTTGSASSVASSALDVTDGDGIGNSGSAGNGDSDSGESGSSPGTTRLDHQTPPPPPPPPPSRSRFGSRGGWDRDDDDGGGGTVQDGNGGTGMGIRHSFQFHSSSLPLVAGDERGDIGAGAVAGAGAGDLSAGGKAVGEKAGAGEVVVSTVGASWTQRVQREDSEEEEGEEDGEPPRKKRKSAGEEEEIETRSSRAGGSSTSSSTTRQRQPKLTDMFQPRNVNARQNIRSRLAGFARAGSQLPAPPTGEDDEDVEVRDPESEQEEFEVLNGNVGSNAKETFPSSVKSASTPLFLPDEDEDVAMEDATASSAVASATSASASNPPTSSSVLLPNPSSSSSSSSVIIDLTPESDDDDEIDGSLLSSINPEALTSRKIEQIDRPEVIRTTSSQTSDDIHLRIDVSEIVQRWKRFREHLLGRAKKKRLLSGRDVGANTGTGTDTSKMKVSGVFGGGASGASMLVDTDSGKAAEATLSRVIEKSDFARMDVLGQFNLGFIIVRKRGAGKSASGGSGFGSVEVQEALGGGDLQADDGDDDLFIVDQHAADEKYNFESLQETCRIKSQRLFRPLTLDLTVADELLATENADVLRQNGFEIQARDDVDGDSGNPSSSEDFDMDQGRNRLSLTALPISKGTVFDLKDLEELLHLLHDQPSGTMVRCSKARAMFASRACRKSVMVGMPLTRAQMTTVVHHMGKMDQPWNCPHGRPTMRHLYDMSNRALINPREVDWASFS